MPQDIFSFAIIAGVIIQATGLIVVIYQLSRLNLSIRVTAQSAVYQQASDARSYLIQFPELRKYFFDSEAIEKTSPDYDRVRTIAELFLNYMEHLILQQGSLRTSDWNAWKNFVYRTVQMSPIMQEILNEQEGWYSGELILLCKEKKTASRKKVETAK